MSGRAAHESQGASVRSNLLHRSSALAAKRTAASPSLSIFLINDVDPSRFTIFIVDAVPLWMYVTSATFAHPIGRISKVQWHDMPASSPVSATRLYMHAADFMHIQKRYKVTAASGIFSEPIVNSRVQSIHAPRRPSERSAAKEGLTAAQPKRITAPTINGSKHPVVIGFQRTENCESEFCSAIRRD